MSYDNAYMWNQKIYTSLIEVCLSEIMPFLAIWRDVEMIILSEGSQTEKDKLPTISLMGRVKKSN